MCAALPVPLVEASQLDAQDVCLDLVDAAVEAKLGVLVAHRLAMAAQQSHTLIKLAATRSHGARFAIRAKVLGEIEAKSGDVADCTGAATLAIDRAVCLAGVLDDHQVLRVGD